MAMPSPDHLAPPLRRLLGEAGFVWDLLHAALRRAPAASTRGGGRAVLVVPGFMMDDPRTRPLRRTLLAAGYAAHGWGLGQNRGATADILDRLIVQVAAAGRGAPVALVGWSLGGIYARELAQLRPDLVERVITLGTPFSGDPRANHAWRLYERVAGHKVDAPPIARHASPKPPVRTIALWSPRDGIVAPAATRGRPDEADLRIEVDCRHTGFTLDPRAIAAVLDALEA